MVGLAPFRCSRFFEIRLLRRSLKLQPYFTATAANCGYKSWSHDIGGHQFGRQKDGELLKMDTVAGVFTNLKVT